MFLSIQLIVATLLAVSPTTISASSAQTKATIKDLADYSHSQKETPSKMDWKVGLQNYKKKNKKQSTTFNVSSHQESVQSKSLLAEESNPVNISSSILANEIHYYRFMTSGEGTISFNVTAPTKIPTVLITNMDGSQVYNNGNLLPEGEYLLVVKDGNGSFSITLNGLTFYQEPEVTLPTLNLTTPSSYSSRLSSNSTSFSFVGNSDASTLTYGIDGSTNFTTLGNNFSETISTDGLSTYNYYGFLATNNLGNSIYRKYEIIYPQIYRVGGSDRVETAVRTSLALNKGTVDSVVIANGKTTMASAIAGAPLTSVDGAPLLLVTSADTIPQIVKDEILRLKPKTAYMIGGTGVLSTNIEAELTALGANPVRLDGINREETSANVADLLTQKQNAKGTPADTAFIINSTKLVDAPYVVSVAIERGYPILFVNTSAIPTSVDSFIRKYPQYKKFVVLGGPTLVSDSVVNQLKSYSTANSVTRIQGATRYEANINFINYFGLKTSTTVLGRGDNVPNLEGECWPDTIVGSTLAAKHHGAVLLSYPNNLDTATQTYLDNQNNAGKKIDQIFAQGGTGAISDSLLLSLNKYLD